LGLGTPDLPPRWADLGSPRSDLRAAAGSGAATTAARLPAVRTGTWVRLLWVPSSCPLAGLLCCSMAVSSADSMTGPTFVVGPGGLHPLPRCGAVLVRCRGGVAPGCGDDDNEAGLRRRPDVRSCDDGGAGLPRRTCAAEVRRSRRKPSLVSWRNGSGAFGCRSPC
jgi:hypothetical protein